MKKTGTVSEMPSRSDLEEIEQAEAELKSKKRKKVLIILLVFVALIFIAIAALFILSRISYDSYEVTEILEDKDSGMNYIPFGDGYLRYSGSGIAKTAKTGSIEWNAGISMRTPIIITKDKYGAIYDRGGNSVTVFSESGIETHISTALPIISAELSEYGVSAVMTGEEGRSLINFYDRGGRELDIEIGNTDSVISGYPINMALSPSGTGLVLSYLFTEGTTIRSDIVFLNFDSGQSLADREVGRFSYQDSIFPELHYLSEDRAVCFADNRIEFYSLKHELSPEVINEYTFEAKVKSIAYSDKYIAMITSDAGGYRLSVFDSEGEFKFDKSFDFEYTNLKISGRNVLIFGGEKTYIVSLFGVDKYLGTFDGNVSDMISLGICRFLQVGDFGAREVTLR